MLALFELFSFDKIQGWIEVGGPLLVFALLFACGLGLPLPEDIPLVLGGFFSGNRNTHWNIYWVSALAWLGIIGGDCMLYSFGKKYGLNITKVPFIGKHVTRERILKAEHLFERYGIWVVAIGRLFAGIRGAMVVAAGATRFNFIKFVIADGLAALVSGGLFIWLGWFAGKKLGSVSEMREKIKDYEHWVFLGLAVVVVGFIVYYYSRMKRHKPLLADVALEKVVERVHEKEQKEHQTHAAQPAPPPKSAPPAVNEP